MPQLTWDSFICFRNISNFADVLNGMLCAALTCLQCSGQYILMIRSLLTLLIGPLWNNSCGQIVLNGYDWSVSNIMSHQYTCHAVSSV